MITAAGILLISKQNRALFLKRGNGGDLPGTWCFPGGRIEDGESSVDAAVRETAEEAGYKPKAADLTLWTRSSSFRSTMPDSVEPGEQVDFTTFICKGVDEFEVEPNDEIVAFAWAPIDSPPEPMHPGCRIAIARFTMNELDIANAMVAGELTSPQRYGGFSLFNIRITGTGIAFRARKLGEKLSAKDRKGKRVDSNGFEITREEEYPVRDPAIYLTQEYLERCNGLPVVLEHPTGQRVDGEEFNKRTIGTVFKPYIKGDEVWAVAKIYDEDAVDLMTEHQLSTSPGVVWMGVSEGTSAVIDGKNFLFEGKPSLMDHIAVCRQGVWDKGGPPAGVETTIARKDALDMDKAELEKMLAEHRQGTDTAISKVLAAVEGLGGVVTKMKTRMDADDEKAEKDRKDKARKDAEDFKFSKREDAEEDEKYKGRHDAEETALCDMYKACGDSEEDAKEKAAKDRKDAEESEEKERKDAAEEEERKERERKDSAAVGEVADLKKQLAELQARVPQVQPRDADAAGFAAIQTRFDDVYAALGQKTPVPMQGESLLNYRRRGLLGIKKHSTTFKDAELGVVANDEATFKAVEDTIIREAGIVARSDASVEPGTLREIVKTLPSGHKETSFIGNTADWFADFSTGHNFAKIHQRNANGVALGQ